MFAVKQLAIATLFIALFQNGTIRMVDVDGVKIRVRTEGLNLRKPAQPIVVFESGGSAPLETWDPIFSAVAAQAPAIAYDRAGTGKSEWDSLPPTPDRIVARLQRLLTSLGASPPYVLVGHSWGGALMRRVERLRGWACRGGEFIVATNARHSVHADEPQLVIEVIRRLLSALKTQ